jgi:uncharacterized protein DUF6221
MTDLVEFLTARLGEDEQSAHGAEGSLGRLNMAWSFPPDGDLSGRVLARDHYVMIPKGTTTIAQHIARHAPARVLREVEAKRRILDRHALSRAEGDPERPWVNQDDCQYDGEPWPCPDLLDLAAAYADHADFQEDWRP